MSLVPGLVVLVVLTMKDDLSANTGPTTVGDCPEIEGLFGEVGKCNSTSHLN